ncbi:hypothetical protein N0V94_002943 [Neodidymelliopsis sp. IMI 364377]|nr:hypothetical protein N0V94_002943 [Neodidymelliopsis sp. IMI 364377]
MAVSGVAYTEKPASNGIPSALDDNKALVMAEMPNTPAAPAQDTDAGELRVAQDPATDSSTSGSAPIEAPAGGTLRGAAIARIEADTERMPHVANVACYTPGCKEYGQQPPATTDTAAATETPAVTDVATYVDAPAAADSPAATEVPEGTEDPVAA